MRERERESLSWKFLPKISWFIIIVPFEITQQMGSNDSPWVQKIAQ